MIENHFTDTTMKKILIPVLFVSVFAAGMSCSRWTEPEALEFPHVTPGQEDPGAYAAYLSRLRAYKQSDHKIMIADFVATGEEPAFQRDHLSSLPDSVDYICVAHPEKMTETLVKEMNAILKDKGTQTLAIVDYMAIQNDWDAMLADLADSGETDLPGDDAFQTYCRERTKAMIDSCDEFGFAGIVVAFKGTTSSSGQQTFMEEVSSWRQKHRNRVMLLHGFVQNILPDYRFLIADSRFIILWTSSYNTAGGLTSYVAGRIEADVPADRFIVETAYPALDNPTQTGIAMSVAAQWVTEEDPRFTKAGLYVSNARDDYFNAEHIYQTIRAAIRTMNTAPANEVQAEE